MAREFGPQGIHVIHAVIDGAIDGERAKTRFPELVQQKGKDGLLQLDAIAETYWLLHCQHPSAWAHELNSPFLCWLGWWLFFLAALPRISCAFDGALASIYPRIPEPMVFDLIRPLGAQQGELEINTLAEYDFEYRWVEWAPEIEYAFADLYAFELELPMENSAVDAYKLALQGTFKNHYSQPRRFIHGWQYIGEYIIDDRRFENNLLYLFGYKFSERWSTLHIVGFRHTDLSSKGDFEGLINGNLCYSIPGGLVLGLEINWERRPNRPNRTLLMPQPHVRLSKHTDLQMGVGLSKANRHFPHLAMRLSYAF